MIFGSILWNVELKLNWLVDTKMVIKAQWTVHWRERSSRNSEKQFWFPHSNLDRFIRTSSYFHGMGHVIWSISYGGSLSCIQKWKKTEVHPVRGTEEFLIKVTSRWARVTLPIQTLFSVVTFENTYRYNAANYVIQSSFLQSVLQHRAMLHNWFIVWVKEFTYYITEVKCN